MTSTAMVKPILESMYELRSEMVPCFIGDPGIGKTQGIYEFAEEKGVKVVTFILSNTVPSEVSGIRMPDKDTKKMEVFDDLRMASLEDGDILFFDEILEAPPMLWSACLTLIQDRIMASGRKLPDVFIVAASNQVASPGIIPASTRDRFQFITLQFEWEHWCTWFQKKYGVRPHSDFADKIQGDSDKYNILTPRRVAKLYEWLKQNPRDRVRRDLISDMFDATVCKALLQMVRCVPSPKQQVLLALADIEINSLDLPELWSDNLTVSDIFSKLQELPEWEAIKEYLSNIELKEQPKDRVML